MKIKVIIADDNSFIREGLKIILSTYEEFEVDKYPDAPKYEHSRNEPHFPFHANRPLLFLIQS